MNTPARVTLAALLVLAAGSCRRKGPPLATLPEPATTFEPSIHRDAPDAHRDVKDARAANRVPLLPDHVLSIELRALVDGAHAHPAVGSLEAAGCELALVMSGRDYIRFVDLRGAEPVQVDDPRADVVWCQSQTAAPPDCAAVAPIFARVARPTRPFHVFSGFNDPPFWPRCSGVHDASGKFVSGKGQGYASSR